MKRSLAAVLLCLFAANVDAATIRATLSWTDNSTDETAFVVERKVGAGSYAVLATLAANSTSHADDGLGMSTSYCYRVLATNALGSSAPSAEACATTPNVPAAPGGLQVIITILP
ncbi:MAG: fibronectin type III domain-containing protein [Actinomycetota bacterium]|nr:fibronectin type III domain-containing protein [Actinomycetota bacterium]